MHKTKLNISDTLRSEINQQETTTRKLASEVGLHQPQISKVLTGTNYQIDTLIKVLDGLGLEIQLVQKK
ncbi:transcriptional regulator [Bacillus phage Thurquoise]|nr:transcriptional regulator [Bacillus phage Thurquoise]